MSYIDFDSIVVCNNLFDEDSLKKQFEFFKMIGIRKIIFTYEFDLEFKTAINVVDKIKIYTDRIKKLKPNGMFCKVTPCMLFTPSLAYNPYLSQFCARKNFMFINFPPFVRINEADYSHFLYRRKIVPICTSFERNLRTNDQEYLDRIVLSKGLRMCVDYNFLFSDDAKDFMMFCLKNNSNVIPCISNDISNYTGIIDMQDYFKEKVFPFGFAKYYGMIVKSLSSLFSLFK